MNTSLDMEYVMQSSKKCFKCNIEKPFTAFYKHRAMADGRLGKCIECAKKDSIKHRKNNLEAIREYDRKRNKLPHRMAFHVINTRHARKTITGYSSAHNAVARALKNGTLIKQSCCMCQSIMVVAHHDDYSKPLEVMWLCSIHHKSRHSFLNYIED